MIFCIQYQCVLKVVKIYLMSDLFVSRISDTCFQLLLAIENNGNMLLEKLRSSMLKWIDGMSHIDPHIALC